MGPDEFPVANDFDLRNWLRADDPNAELRAAYFRLVDQLDHAANWLERMPEYVDLDLVNRHAIWTGGDLAVALKREKNRLFAARVFCYTNSAGEQVPLTLLDIEHRLYDLSFDPNHPPELRWGAPPGGAEWGSAPETHTPLPDGSRMGEIVASTGTRCPALFRLMSRPRQT